MVERLRLDDVRTVNGRVPIIVLEQRDGVLNVAVGNKDDADPVMDEAVRHVDLLADPQPLGHDLAAAQRVHQLSVPRVRQGIHPQERFRPCHLGPDALLHDSGIRVKGH